MMKTIRAMSCSYAKHTNFEFHRAEVVGIILVDLFKFTSSLQTDYIDVFLHSYIFTLMATTVASRSVTTLLFIYSLLFSQTAPGQTKRLFRKVKNLISAFEKPDQGIAVPLLYPVTVQKPC